MSRIRKKKRLMAEINVVPYIDVMLVLLVIFMVTAPLLSTGVDVNLPAADAQPMEPDPDNEPFVLTVDATGKFYLNESTEAEVEPDEVTRKVAAVLKHKPNTPFLVRGDEQAVYGEVIKGMVLLQSAGVAKVGMVMQAPQ